MSPFFSTITINQPELIHFIITQSVSFFCNDVLPSEHFLSVSNHTHGQGRFGNMREKREGLHIFTPELKSRHVILHCSDLMNMFSALLLYGFLYIISLRTLRGIIGSNLGGLSKDEISNLAFFSLRLGLGGGFDALSGRFWNGGRPCRWHIAKGSWLVLLGHIQTKKLEGKLIECKPLLQAIQEKVSAVFA